MNASGARITGYPPEIDISLIIYSTPINYVRGVVVISNFEKIIDK